MAVIADHVVAAAGQGQIKDSGKVRAAAKVAVRSAAVGAVEAAAVAVRAEAAQANLNCGAAGSIHPGPGFAISKYL